MRSMLVAPSGERQLVELKAVDPAWPLSAPPEIEPADPLRLREGARGRGASSPPPGQPRPARRAGRPRPPRPAPRRHRPPRQRQLHRPRRPDRRARPRRRPADPRPARADRRRRAGVDRPGRARLHGAVRPPRHPARPGLAPRLPPHPRSAFPGQGWRIRDPRDAAPGVTRFIDQTSLFLTLVGLTSLLVGGIGVANGVRAWLDARARTIATLRCLGASSAPGVRRLPDPGAGAGPLRHRASGL